MTPTRKNGGEEWEVFARNKRGAEFYQIGTVRAPNRRLAQAYALMTYDEEHWVDLAVVRRSDITWVRRLKPMVSQADEVVAAMVEEEEPA